MKVRWVTIEVAATPDAVKVLNEAFHHEGVLEGSFSTKPAERVKDKPGDEVD